MKDLNQDLAANDPESLLAVNEGFDDPGELSGDREPRRPNPFPPKHDGTEAG